MPAPKYSPSNYVEKLKLYVKFLFISYLISGLFLLLAALLFYKMKLQASTAQILVYSIYAISCAVGGFFIGKSIGQRRFLWGLLFGILYIVILFLISLTFPTETNPETGHIITRFIICLASGCIGGIVS